MGPTPRGPPSQARLGGRSTAKGSGACIGTATATGGCANGGVQAGQGTGIRAVPSGTTRRPASIQVDHFPINVLPIIRVIGFLQGIPRLGSGFLLGKLPTPVALPPDVPVVLRRRQVEPSSVLGKGSAVARLGRRRRSPTMASVLACALPRGRQVVGDLSSTHSCRVKTATVHTVPFSWYSKAAEGGAPVRRFQQNRRVRKVGPVYGPSVLTSQSNFRKHVGRRPPFRGRGVITFRHSLPGRG